MERRAILGRGAASDEQFSLGRTPGPDDSSSDRGSMVQPKFSPMDGGGVQSSGVAALTIGVAGRDLVPPQKPIGIDMISGGRIGGILGSRGLPDRKRFGVDLGSRDPNQKPEVPWGLGREKKPGEMFGQYTGDKHRMGLPGMLGGINRPGEKEHDAMIDSLVQSKTLPGSDPGSRFGKRKRPTLDFNVRAGEPSVAERQRSLVALGLSKDPNRGSPARFGPKGWNESSTGGLGGGGGGGDPGSQLSPSQWGALQSILEEGEKRKSQLESEARRRLIEDKDPTYMKGLHVWKGWIDAHTFEKAREAAAEFEFINENKDAEKKEKERRQKEIDETPQFGGPSPPPGTGIGYDDPEGTGIGSPRAMGATITSFVSFSTFIDPLGDGGPANPRTYTFMPSPDDNGPGGPHSTIYRPSPDDPGGGGPTSRNG